VPRGPATYAPASGCQSNSRSAMRTGSPGLGALLGQLVLDADALEPVGQVADRPRRCRSSSAGSSARPWRRAPRRRRPRPGSTVKPLSSTGAGTHHDPGRLGRRPGQPVLLDGVGQRVHQLLEALAGDRR
jgi:hypothetical protein